MCEPNVRVFPALIIAPLLAPVVAWVLYSVWIGGLWMIAGETDPYVPDAFSALLALLVFFLYGGPAAYLGTAVFVVPGILVLDFIQRLEFKFVLPLATIAGALSSMVWTNSACGLPSACCAVRHAGSSSGGWRAEG